MSDYYKGRPPEDWLRITRKLVSRHPLFSDRALLLDCIHQTWDALWATQVGSGDLVVSLAELSPRAQIVGDFFENLLAIQLSRIGPWRRGSSKEKDLIFVGNAPKGKYDFEIKTSGQATGKIYGNRSYAQPDEEGNLESPSRKKRSGYYLCINFWSTTIYSIRVGWIDPEDWEPQRSPTGQMAGLKDYVYDYKLVPIPGEFYLQAPLFVLSGVGAKTVEGLNSLGVKEVGDLVRRVALRVADTDAIPGVKEFTKALVDIGLEARTASRLARSLKRCDYFRSAWKLHVRYML